MNMPPTKRRGLAALLLLLAALLAGCGMGDAASGPLAGEPPPPSDSGEVEPIVRSAECAFPQRMRVGKPATVRFSIFTAGNRPNELPGADAQIEPLELPQRPDLEVWVAVSLDVNGRLVEQDRERRMQRLSERSNIWVWQVTPDEATALTLQPIVDVEFRDANGEVVASESNVWTQTYTVEDVVGRGPVDLAGAWLGDSVSQLVTGMLGTLLMTFVVNPTRRVAGRFGRGKS